MDQDRVAQAVADMLRALGQDPEREGLRDTPARVARSYRELLAGYDQHPAEVLRTDFENEGYDEMIVLRDIPFHSLCEHHMLPFSGRAAVGYIPNGRVVGLSKLARLVECFARRLQIQERMTVQIGSALLEHLHPRGYAVVISAQHLCMCARGVGKPGSAMVTMTVGGLIKEDPKARDEFLRHAGV